MSHLCGSACVLPSLLPNGAQVLGDRFQGEETFSSPTPATCWSRGIPAHLLSGAVGADCQGLWVMTAPHGWEWDPCSLGHIESLSKPLLWSPQQETKPLKSCPSPCCGLPQQHRRAAQAPLTLSLVWVPLLPSQGAGISCGCISSTSSIP